MVSLAIGLLLALFLVIFNDRLPSEPEAPRPLTVTIHVIDQGSNLIRLYEECELLRLQGYKLITSLEHTTDGVTSHTLTFTLLS